MEEFKPTLVLAKHTKPGNERKPRYPNSPEMQEFWEKRIKEEILFLETDIKWFKEFSRRQWSYYENSKTVRDILKMQKDRKQYFIESLRRGDYADA